MSKTIYHNREQWLQEATTKLRPLFLGQGFTVPEVRVSCGFPSRGATSPSKRRIGECWSGLQAADGMPQLFISPFLCDPVAPCGVLPTLIHELIHATIGTEAAHGPRFKKAATKMWLEGKPTSTTASPELVERLGLLVKDIGAYPHSELKLVSERKKQTTRMRKCECEACGYTIRLTQKWMDVGIPACPIVGHGILTSEVIYNEPPDE